MKPITFICCGGPGDQTPYHRKYNRSVEAMETTLDTGQMTRKLEDGKHVFWMDINLSFRRPDGPLTLI